jgi:hypothetical protein
MAATRGYQWKSLFLPDGTLLRTVFGGKNFHCLVENDQILYNSQPVSPSGFVNAAGGMRRNAWRSIWILLPENKEWKLADTLRTRLRPPRARKSGRAAKPAQAIPPGAASATPVRDPVSDQAETRANESAEVSDIQHAGMQHAREEKLPQTGSNAERQRRRQSFGSTPSAPPCHHGTDRRARTDAGTAILLREELLPLLNRLCQLHEGAPNIVPVPGALHDTKKMPVLITKPQADLGYARSWSYQLKPG